MRNALLNIDGFTKIADPEYIQQLAHGSRSFKYPLKLALHFHVLDYQQAQEQLQSPNIPVITFKLEARSTHWDYWEGYPS